MCVIGHMCSTSYCFSISNFKYEFFLTVLFLLMYYCSSLLSLPSKKSRDHLSGLLNLLAFTSMLEIFQRLKPVVV